MSISTGLTRTGFLLRLQELQAVRAVLLPDADDPRVMSELVAVEREIARIKQHPLVAGDSHRPEAPETESRVTAPQQ